MRIKKYSIVLLLLALLTWGLCHPVIVYFYDMNPWKLFGMAMYCVPQSQLSAIHFADTSSGERRLIPFPDKVSEQKRAKQLKYLSLRRHTGSLLAPDVLAEHSFELRPDLTRLEIVIVFWAYSLEESRMVKHSDGYLYERTVSGTGSAGVKRVSGL